MCKTPRFLLIQLADIGDLVLTTPAIHALREAHPQAHLTLLASSHAAPVLDASLVDEIITLDRAQFNSSKAMLKPANLRRILSLGSYDIAIIFHHFTLKLGTFKFWLMTRRCKRRIGLQNGNAWFLTDSIPDAGFGAKHQAQYWLDLVGLVGAKSDPRPVNIAHRESKLLSPSKQKTVVIHPGSGGYSLARRWDVGSFAQLADKLFKTFEARIVLVGGIADSTGAVEAAMQSPALDLGGKTSLPELANIIQQADLYIGADSGVMHLASGTNTPILALFGPSNHRAWGPWSGQATIIRADVECSPCSYVGHKIGLRDGCDARTCMRLIHVEQVFKAASNILRGEIVTQLGANTPPTPIQRDWQRIDILGTPVDGITYTRWLKLISEWIARGDRCYHVCTTNPEFIMIARDDVNFRNILQRADLCVPDGVGLLWAAKRQHTPLPERVTGSDGVPIICEHAAQRGWKLFFLGAAPGIAEAAANIMRARYPGVQIVGTYSGSPAPEEEDYIVQLINESGADVLFVAYGAPKQDKWIARNLPRLRVSMAMGVGGAFDFIAGIVPRAPQWMQKAGLEWLYRLYLQPWRIKRMMRLPRFALAVVLNRRAPSS